MQNLSDNELDKRFKDAADGYRPPFDPEAWQAMEQQLDRDAGDPGTGFRSTIGRYLPFVLIFLTGSVTGILTWNQFSGNDTNTLSHLSTQTKPVQTQTEAGLARRGSDDVKSGLDNNTETDSRLADLAISKNQTGEGNDLSKPESGSVSTKRPHAREKAGEQNLSGEHYNGTRNAGLTPVNPSVRASHQNPAGTSQSDESRAGTKSNPTAEFPSNDLSVATEGDAAFEQDESHVNVIKDSDNEEKRSQDDLSAANDSTTRIVKSDNTTPTNYESDESREDEKRPSTPLNMFSIAVAFSPDYSSVNFSAHTRPGTNAGLLVEYHFSSRISAQSGAILSQKIYSARNLEYNGYTAQTADGDCHIVDIPVNIIYRLPSRGNYSITSQQVFHHI